MSAGHHPAAAAPPRVLVAGATGLIGRALLQQLQARQPAVRSVVALVRQGGRTPAWAPPVSSLAVDYGTLGQAGTAALPAADWALCALGTTIKVAGSPAAFRAVDVDAVLAFGRAARQAGVTRLGLVSAAGADGASRVFYNRCKGEAEAGLRALGFEQLVLARPSLLLGDRAALGQPERRFERLAQRLSPLLNAVLPLRWQPIAADTVARALLRAVAEGRPGVQVLESDDLQHLGAPGTTA